MRNTENFYADDTERENRRQAEEFLKNHEKRLGLFHQHKTGKLDKRTYALKDGELRAASMRIFGLDSESAPSRESFDRVAFGRGLGDSPGRVMDAMAWNRFSARFQAAAKQISESGGGIEYREREGKLPDGEKTFHQEIPFSARDFLRFMNVAETIDTADVQADVKRLAPVSFDMKDTPFTDLIQCVPVTALEIDEYREDDTTTEGEPAARAEGAVSVMIDFGTEKTPVKLPSITAQIPLNLEVLQDANRAFFYPYLMMAIFNALWYKLEKQNLAGAGGAMNIRGIENQAGHTPAGTLKSALDVADVDLLLDDAKTVRDNSHRNPDVLLIDNLLMTDLMKLRHANGQLIAPHLRDPEPRINRVPAVVCDGMSARTAVTADLRDVICYIHGGVVSIQMGPSADQLAKLQLTIVANLNAGLHCRLPKRIVKRGRAA